MQMVGILIIIYIYFDIIYKKKVNKQTNHNNNIHFALGFFIHICLFLSIYYTHTSQIRLHSFLDTFHLYITYNLI